MSAHDLTRFLSWRKIVYFRVALPVAKASGLSITKPPEGGYLPRFRLRSLLQQA